MPTDIELFQQGGGLQPYSPSQPLAPSPADYWGTEPDYGTDLTTDSQAPLFDPAHAEIIQQNVGQIAGMFLSDFSYLAHNQAHINHSIRWFQQHIGRDFTMPVKRHSYALYQYANDAAMQHFANFAHSKGMSAKMVSDICWWVSELEKRLDSTAVDTPATDGTLNYQEPELTDKEWKIVEQQNVIYAAQTETVLRDKWKSSYSQNIKSAQDWINGLPANERNALDKWTNVNGQLIHSFNTVEVLEFAYKNSIGAGNLPAGAALASEIAEIESVMRTNRKAYNNDIRLQSRLRELYRRRDG